MKRKLTLSIDSEVYEKIKNLPRSLNISKLVSHLLECFANDMNTGVWIDQDTYHGYLVGEETGDKLRKKLKKECIKYMPEENDMFMQINNIVEAKKILSGRGEADWPKFLKERKKKKSKRKKR